MKGKIIVQSLQKRRFQKRLLKRIEKKKNTIYLKKNIQQYRKEGSFGLFSSSSKVLGQLQLESARKYLYRHLKAGGRKKLVVRLFPVYPDVRKPQEVRMGKGKGQKLVDYIQKVAAGKFLYGFQGRSVQLLRVFRSKLGRFIKIRKIQF